MVKRANNLGAEWGNNYLGVNDPKAKRANNPVAKGANDLGAKRANDQGAKKANDPVIETKRE